ncbi:retention module-containing protein [Thiomicrorhabdus sp.]|uniref:retention module-containing protein n=1 Tax=Thiomicrorhabdus sp. TaxID=2039724 RepID=UPI00356A1A0F
MSVIAGKVNVVTGFVQAINPNSGEVRILKEGDEVFIGDIILTSAMSGVSIALNNGEILTLGRDTEMLLDEDILGSSTDPVTENGVDADTLKKAILEGANIENLEETGAGNNAVSSANSGGEALVERLAYSGSVSSGMLSGVASSVENFIRKFHLFGTTNNVEEDEPIVIASVIIPNEMDYYGSEGDLKLQAKISVDGLGCDLPKFIISENLKDADGNDLFIIDSITGELKITEAGVNSFTNDAESLPDLHSINVHIENGHGGIGVKEMILVEKNPFYCAPDGTSDMGSIDSLLCCDDENSENDVFEFL